MLPKWILRWHINARASNQYNALQELRRNNLIDVNEWSVYFNRILKQRDKALDELKEKP